MNREESVEQLREEIASRDERIGELENVASYYASRNEELRAELSAIKAREPAVYIPVNREFLEEIADSLDYGVRDVRDKVRSLLAAPVSEAKVQGVVMPDNLLSHRVTWRQALARLIELEDVADPETGRDDKAYWQHELRAFDDMYADLDRLKADPVQQVGVPDERAAIRAQVHRSGL